MGTSVAIKLEANYRVGVNDRKNGRPITTKAQFIRNHEGYEKDQSMILDMYLAYSKGYRASAPSIPSVGGVAA